VTIPSNCHIKGAGRNVTILKQADSADLADIFQNSDTTNGNTFATFEDITFDGNKANNTVTASTMVNYVAGGDLIFRSCEFKNNRGQAIEIESSGSVDFKRIWLDKCYFHDGSPAGVTEESIRIDTNPSSTIEDVWVTDCKFLNTQGRQFIKIAGVDADTDPIKRVRIFGCSFEDCGAVPMQLELVNDLIVANCNIYDSDSHGCFVTGGTATDEVATHRIVFADNTVRTYAGNGIEVSGGGHTVSITGNTFEDGSDAAKSGVSAGSQKAVSITGNSVLNSAGGGIAFRADSGNTAGGGPVVVSGNTIDADADKAVAGISGTTNVPGCIVSNNSVRNYAGGIKVADNATGPIVNLSITGNTVESCAGIGIWVRGKETGSISAKRVVVSGNVVANGSNKGINLNDVIESVCSSNVVYNNADHGILYDGADSSNSICSNNLVYDNTKDGIAFASTDADNLVIKGNIVTGNGSEGINCSNAAYNNVVLEGNHSYGNTSTNILTTASTNVRRDPGTMKGTDIASAATIAVGETGNFFDVTGTADITSVTASWPGRVVVLQFDGTAATNGVVNGSNLQLTGNFAYSPLDTLVLVCDGTNWYEMSRSANV
jgi:hypothetical protein